MGHRDHDRGKHGNSGRSGFFMFIHESYFERKG